VRGPLHGIPVLLKDNIDTADRMMTTAGSLALVGHAGAARRLHRGAAARGGAVILGKTNLSEWANFRSTHSSSGWSARGGQGRNPYALDRSTSGSSSGSAAAVAANFTAVAVGTETDGSIVSPSGACSIVGIKPTLGLVSRAGIIPIAHSQDTAGPMGRTWPTPPRSWACWRAPTSRDRATARAAGRPADYTRFLDPNALRGARIGVPRKKFFGYDPHADRVAENAIRATRDAGATIVDPADIPHAGEYDEGEFEVLLYEFKADLNEYLASRGATTQVRTLADVIAFNERNRDREMPYFGQEIMEMAQKKGPLSEARYRAALARNRRLAGPEGIDAVMRRHRLDALVAPTGNPPWAIDLVVGDHFLARAPPPRRWRGTPASRSPPGTCTACRWGSPSSAAPGASRR
jgi:amidase